MESLDPVAVALAVGSPTLVKFSLDVLRGMQLFPTRWLPCAGLLLGWLYVGLIAVVQHREPSVESAAAIVLGGAVAFLIAAGMTENHRAARGAVDRGRPVS